MCLACVRDGKGDRHKGRQPKPRPTFHPSTDTSDPDLAWAAGFFDGEGWTSRTGSGPYARTQRRHIQIGVSQNDLRPLLRFKAIVGEGAISDTRKLKAWRAGGAHAYRVMERLWPHLSEPKREQWLRVEAEIV